MAKAKNTKQALLGDDTQVTVDPPCVPKVMKLSSGTRLLFGRWGTIQRYPADLRVRFGDSSRDAAALPTYVANEEAKALLPPALWSQPETPALLIDWPDFDLPGVPVMWWHDFADWAIDEDRGLVAMGCDGGRGRTGCAYAILGVLTEVIASGDPVTATRRDFCWNAIETDEQVGYVSNLTGRTSKEKGSSWIPSRWASSDPLFQR